MRRNWNALILMALGTPTNKALGKACAVHAADTVSAARIEE